MNFKIAAFLAVWLTFGRTLIYAQSGFILTGHITDSLQKPLDGAAIYLLKADDSSLVKTSLTDASGAFSFSLLKPGAYKFSVSMVGFQAYRSPTFQLDQGKTLASLALAPQGTTLKEVSISGRRSFVQQKADRTVINPEALISNAGSTALDVLEKAPGVMIDQNGTISLKGKSVTIFIDDKPTYLSGAELENYLRSLGAAAIDQLELMSTPPAKYDAAGNGGVINIRTKKTKVAGFNAALNLSYSQGRYGKTINSANFNYRKKRLNLFGNFSYSHYDLFNNLVINRHFLNADGSIKNNFVQQSFIRNTGDNKLAKIGADYYISDKSTLGVNLTGVYNSHAKITPVTSSFSGSTGQLDSTVLADNRQHDYFKNAGANLNYRHQFDKNGHEFTADADYLGYTTNNSQSFANSSYLPGGALTGTELLTGTLPAHIDIYSAKADYDHPLQSGLKLSTGLKSSYTHTDNIADYFYTQGTVTLPDYGKTNHFIYQENINAAYINAVKEYKQLSIQAGLRLENTQSNGHQLGNIQKPDSTFKNAYTNLFPTFYLQYKADTQGNNQFGLRYGRRIDRPYYQDLNPFLSPLDKFTYYAGNPFLKPSFTDNIELSHTYKNRLTTTFSYSQTRDDVNETIEIVNGIYYSRPGNIGKNTNLTLSVDASADPAKWLGFHFYGQVSQLHSVSNFYTGVLDTKGTFYFIKPVLIFKPGKDWTAQIDGLMQSRLTTAQFVLGRKGKINAALAKKLSKAASVKLVVNDLFYTYQNGGQINNLAQTTADWIDHSDTRTVVLSFNYRFGETITGKRQHQANGAESEQTRVKT